MLVFNSVASANQQSGIATAGTSGVVIRIGTSVVTQNNIGLNPGAPSQILSYGNNMVATNNNDGGATGPVSPK